MGVSTLHVVHGVVTPASFYSQIQNGRVASNTNILTALPTGHFRPAFRSIQSQGPVIEFTTSQLATALNEFGETGFGFAAGQTVDFYEKKVSNLGTRVANLTAEHNRFRVNQSLGYIASINAPHQGVATADVRILASYDGTTSPIICAGSTALPATLGTAAEYYGAGPIKIDSGSGLVAFPGIQSIAIDFAVTPIEVGSETEIWDSFKAIGAVVPVVTFTAIDGTAFDDLTSAAGVDGVAVSSLVVYLRKKASEGMNVADDGTTHISFTFTGGIVVPDDNSGGQNDPVVSTYTFYPTADDADVNGDELVVIDTTADIA